MLSNYSDSLGHELNSRLEQDIDSNKSMHQLVVVVIVASDKFWRGDKYIGIAVKVA